MCYSVIIFWISFPLSAPTSSDTRPLEPSSCSGSGCHSGSRGWASYTGQWPLDMSQGRLELASMGQLDPRIDATWSISASSDTASRSDIEGVPTRGAPEGAGAVQFFSLLAPCKAQEGGILRARSVTKEKRLLGFTAGAECGISVCTVTAGTSNLLHAAFCE